MDIVIRNGVIQANEAKRIRDIKNDEGLLKKDYCNYIRGQPGPYYDFLECHLHVPRFPKDIANFHGPQNSKKIKMDFYDFSDKNKYCCICHKLMKVNSSFPPRKTYFESVVEDEYSYSHPTNESTKESNKELIKKSNDGPTRNIKKILQKYIHKTNIFYIKQENDSYKKKIIKIISMYYKIIYKILYKPIIYPISIKESKLLWPWEMTNYQKLRLKFPKYKELCIFSNNNFDKFRTNYVIID